MMKNMLNKNLVLMLFVVLFSLSVFADVPPPRNEMRIDIDLSFTPREDFDDYRFFLASGRNLEEITIKKDVPVIINGENRRGENRYAALIAIPKTNLKDVAKLSDDEQEKINVSILKKESTGFITILRHQFSEDIPIGERVNKIYPVYEIKREANLPKAFEGQGISRKLDDEEEAIITSAKYEKATIIGGILLTLAVLFGGMFLFRRSRK
jgi:hypothetical protein